MPDTGLRILHVPIGNRNNPKGWVLLQMKRVGFREAKGLGQGHVASSGKVGIRTQVSLASGLILSLQPSTPHPSTPSSLLRVPSRCGPVSCSCTRSKSVWGSWSNYPGESRIWQAGPGVVVYDHHPMLVHPRQSYLPMLGHKVNPLTQTTR